MDFDQPVQDLDIPQVDTDLLALQKRKSVPTVCITEFVDDDVEVSDEDEAACGEKCHHRIEDFGKLNCDGPKHIGLEEVSPLEGKNG